MRKVLFENVLANLRILTTRTDLTKDQAYRLLTDTGEQIHWLAHGYADLVVNQNHEISHPYYDLVRNLHIASVVFYNQSPIVESYFLNSFPVIAHANEHLIAFDNTIAKQRKSKGLAPYCKFPVDVHFRSGFDLFISTKRFHPVTFERLS